MELGMIGFLLVGIGGALVAVNYMRILPVPPKAGSLGMIGVLVGFIILIADAL